MSSRVDAKRQYAAASPSPIELVEKHSVLVKRIAHHLMARLPDTVLIDDLLQSGLEGLLEASKNYDASKGASFETFAGIRIRGAMLDEIRRGDWAPRSVHRNARRLAEAMKQVESQKGVDASDREVADVMGVTLDEYHHIAKDTMTTRLFSFDESINEDDGQSSSRGDMLAGDDPTPEEQVTKIKQQERMADAIKELPERDQLLLNLYYEEEMNLKEIGLILGVSESRVSQLHSQATLRLRSKLIEDE